MNNGNTVSVVMPVYNVGKFLEEAINSVLRQNPPPDEIIVVDDGSTDNTADAARKFGGGIIYLKQPNSGPAAARNLGIQHAKSRWIAFIDGDDVWLPWHLNVEFRVISKYPEAALFCGSSVDLDEKVCVPGDEGPLNARIIPLMEFVKHNPVMTSTVLALKEAICVAGGFDTNFRGPEDFDLWMRISKRYPSIYIDIPLVRYRQRAGSLSADDRLFLPQVLSVLDKAFGEDGSLREYAGFKSTAYSRQYLSASLMADARGDRITALRYLFKAYALLHRGKRYPGRIDHKWVSLLFNYLLGRYYRKLKQWVR